MMYVLFIASLLTVISGTYTSAMSVLLSDTPLLSFTLTVLFKSPYLVTLQITLMVNPSGPIVKLLHDLVALLNPTV